MQFNEYAVLIALILAITIIIILFWIANYFKKAR